MDYRGSLYRIIITRAMLRDDSVAKGREDIVSSAVRTIPLVEVLIDTKDCTVMGIEDPVTKGQYGNIPMPVF